MIEAAKKNLPKPAPEPELKPKDTSKIEELKKKLAQLPSEITTKSGKKIDELVTVKRVEKEKRKSSDSRKRDQGRKESARPDSPPRKPKSLSYEQLMKLAKTTTVEGLIKPAEKKEETRDKSKERKDRSSEREKSVDRDKDRYIQRPLDKYTDRPVEKYRSHSDRPSSNLIVPSSRTSQKSNPVSRKKGVKNPPPDLIRLQKQKRDLATIEEVQAELAKRKGKDDGRDRRDDRLKSDIRRMDPRDRYDSRDRVGMKTSSSKESLKKSGSKESLNRKKPVYSDEELDYDYKRKKHCYSDDDDYNYRKKRKHDLTDESYVETNVSSIIGDMFGYNRNKYRDDYSDDSSDMEAGYDDVLREEKRSLKIGKKEDLEEELRQEREKARKYKR
ncbi:hypothetical protein HDV04_001685 [Boothiomyces sp. JEL0838]|nr:hypothetical protein HDV04_001685 [Boothiomyces sp. JEL0838]